MGQSLGWLELVTNADVERVRWRRADLSFFLVHLTKGEGNAPKEKLIEILTEEPNGYCRLAGSPQGLFTKVEDVDPNVLRAVSFTEAPLDQIKHFAYPIKGDPTRKYSGYGLVFDQEFVRNEGGNPCFYVNTYKDIELKKAVLDLVHVPGFTDRKCAKLLPFFNIFGPAGRGYSSDFYWEREWRVPQDLWFTHKDVFVGLCNTEEVEEFSSRFEGIPFICPDWNYDKILRELKRYNPS
jgi:hypothetical protein